MENIGKFVAEACHAAPPVAHSAEPLPRNMLWSVGCVANGRTQAEKIGVPKGDLFQTVDLYESGNPVAVTARLILRWKLRFRPPSLT